MTFGTWLLAGLLLAANTLPGGVEPMANPHFEIPIVLEPARLAEVKQVLLFVSNDQGKTWRQQAAVGPETRAFDFNAPAEGEYWFAVGVVNQQGQQDPENVYEAKAKLKILVDTLKPDLRVLSAERVGDEVVVKWEAKDANLDPTSLTLEYRTPESLPNIWTPVTVTAASSQASFRPGSLGAVQYRMTVKDLVGNVGTAAGEVAAAPGAATVSTATAANVGAAPPPSLPGATPPAPPPMMPGPLPTPSGDTGLAPVQQAARRSVDQPPAWSQPGLGTNVIVNGTHAGQPIADSRGTPQGSAAGSTPLPGQYLSGSAPPAPPAPTAPLPPLQIIKDRQITLQYGVRDVGPSGLGSVELWVTRDEGRTWQLSGGAQTVPPSAAAESKGGPGAVQLSLPVELPGEGQYGFYIVVKSKAGLGTPPPQPGTPPRLRVEVDTTPPEATLFMPQPKEGRRDTLLLSWQATDHNLPSTPVTLEWAEHREGPWNLIARNLPNEPASYSWQLPAGTALPPRVYLRLTVRDSAGNVCVAETADPVLIDLSAPSVENISLAGKP